MFFRRQSQDGSQWVTLIQDGSTVHAAQVVYTAEGRPRLDWMWQGPAQSMAAGLLLLQANKRLKGCSLVGVLNRTHYRMLSTDAPDVPREDWRDAMRWHLKEQVDFPVDDAVLDVLEVPQGTSRSGSAVMTFLVPRADYTAVELGADDLGLHWRALDVPETALRNLCALGEDADRAHALMAFGETHGMLVITYKGELLMARQIEVALSAVAGDEEARCAALSRASLEILRTVDTFERMHSQVQLSGLTVALPPGCGAESLEMLAELIYVPLQPLCLSAWFDLEQLAGDGAPFSEGITFTQLCALGAALRAHPALTERPQVRLLDPNSVLGQAPPWGAVLGVRLAGGVVAVGLAAGLGLHAAAGGYNLQADKIEQEVNTLRVSVAANPPSPIVKELDALRQKDAQQRQVQDTLQGSMAWSSQGYSDYLMALGRQTHPSVWITGLHVRGDGRDINLIGRTDNATALPDYLKRLGREERFKGRRFAQMEMSALDGSDATAGVVQFTLKGLRKEVEDTTTREAALRAVGKMPDGLDKEDAKK
jgi:MSHA biogenesis protein MshI